LKILKLVSVCFGYIAAGAMASMRLVMMGQAFVGAGSVVRRAIPAYFE
jgi:acetyltransferase-like isoleucine patch superfamily enzyme|tara:strand:+ start:2412 stop:2555 length:144 start_codon:yes stop_codon:yes gene_type:complete